MSKNNPTGSRATASELAGSAKPEVQQNEIMGKENVTASEIASLIAVLVAGFELCKYVFSLATAPSQLEEKSRVIEKNSLLLVSFACGFAFMLMPVFDFIVGKTSNKFKSFTSRLTRRQRGYAVTALVCCLGPAWVLSDKFAAYMVVPFIVLSTALFITSNKLNELARFCVLYFCSLFIMILLLLFVSISK